MTTTTAPSEATPAGVAVASTGADAAAVAAVEQHHAELAARLAAHVQAMLATAGDPAAPPDEIDGSAGVPEPAQLTVGSLQPKGVLRQATLSGGAVADARSLLALRVNGAPLAGDHGYPARIIVPGLPGVHNTKWVGRLELRA